jgi:hypothetical protein
LKLGDPPIYKKYVGCDPDVIAKNLIYEIVTNDNMFTVEGGGGEAASLIGGLRGSSLKL